MHLIVLTESGKDGFDQFTEWLKQQTFTTGGHPKVREVRLLDINIKESDKQRVVDMLIRQEPANVNNMNPIEAFEPFISMLPGLESAESEKKIAREKRIAGKINEPYFHDTKRPYCYAVILGKMKDLFDETGVERI